MDKKFDQEMQAFEADMTDSKDLVDAFNTASEITRGLTLLQEMGARFTFNIKADRVRFDIETNIPIEGYGFDKKLTIIAFDDGSVDAPGDAYNAGADNIFIDDIHEQGRADQVIGFVHKYAMMRKMEPGPQS